MEAPLVLSLVSTLLSLVALIASSVLAYRQAMAARSQAMINFSMVLARVNSAEFLKNIDYIRGDFPGRFDSNVPVSELPLEARDKIVAVVNYFDQLGVLVAFRALDQEIVIGYMGNWLDQVWEILECHILGERNKRFISKRRNESISSGYLKYFDHLVWLARADPPEKIQRRQKLRSVVELG
ncbi:DUF4760 domain-containing protein [Amycolatopsis anabasis]|uniref:DUF4760 domain-containing protein n=1 Tax=Amycolatopsis anabasis TaxID=1840409 RepID=UPI00131B807E|nr:hypothetical protein [Amycolatopsis anabasis]